MKFSRNNKGTAIVEFAIILPLLLALLLGIIEFSLLLFDKAMITNASREGARAGIVYNFNITTHLYDPLDDGQIGTVVDNYLANHLVTFSPANATTTVVPSQCPDPTVTGIRQITVTVDYPYTFLVLPNLVTNLAGLNPLWLQAVTIMRCE